MKKSRKLLMILGIVLSLAVATGTTLAYLTDTDSDVNVMTLGNVSIKQIEKERIEQSDDNTADTNIQDFTQGKPLYPSVYDDQYADWARDDEGNQVYQGFPTGGFSAMWTDEAENAVDKIVFVENDGKSDAYVRTWFAFEQGSMTEEEFEAAVGQNINNTHWVWENVAYGVEIDGNKYAVKMATYKGSDTVHPGGILPAGETTRPSLLQTMLYKTVTNEDCEAIDGNKNGTYDILVLSQAVQTAGFDNAKDALDEAFGEATEENVPWDAVKWPGFIMNAQEAYDSSLTNGEYTLGNDIVTSEAENHFSGNREYAIKSGNEYTLNLNGHTFNHDGTYQDGKNTGYTYLYTTAYEGKLTINGEGEIRSENPEGSCCIVYAQGPSEVVINGGDFYTTRGIPVWAGKGAKVTINGGSFISYEANGDEELIYSSGGVIDIYGGFFHNTEWEGRPVNVADANRNTGFINIYGGTFVNFDPSTGGNDPSNIKVAEGYTVVSETQENGDIWYTVVKK